MRADITQEEQAQAVLTRLHQVARAYDDGYSMPPIFQVSIQEYETLCAYGEAESSTSYPDPCLWNRDGELILWGSYVQPIEHRPA